MIEYNEGNQTRMKKTRKKTIWNLLMGNYSFYK